jgi:hypothetical protein
LQEYNQQSSKENHITYPVMMSPTEYGQFSYSRVGSAFGDNYAWNILWFQEWEKTTLGSIINNEEDFKRGSTMLSAPTMFVPRDDGEWMMQIN